MSEQGEVKTDQAKVQRCMNMAAAYRASGHKAKVWAQANGVNDRMLSSWCAHAIRWQARADGIEPGAIQRKAGACLSLLGVTLRCLRFWRDRWCTPMFKGIASESQ